MAAFNERAYQNAVIAALRHDLDVAMKSQSINISNAAKVALDLIDAARSELRPAQVRALVCRIAKECPFFEKTRLHPSYLKDENGTWAKILGGVVAAVARPTDPEVREFTRVFARPIGVVGNERGIFILYNSASDQARWLAEYLRKVGWTPDESLEPDDLRKANRVRLIEQSRKRWAGDAVTVRFRR